MSTMTRPSPEVAARATFIRLVPVDRYPASQWARAVDRIPAAGKPIRISSIPTQDLVFRDEYRVPSRSQLGREWHVTVLMDQRDEWLGLGCDCPAGDARKVPCWHQAAVLQRFYPWALPTSAPPAQEPLPVIADHAAGKRSHRKHPAAEAAQLYAAALASGDPRDIAYFRRELDCWHALISKEVPA